MSEPPLFQGEPDHCSLCGEAGHTHDDHWLFQHDVVQRLQARADSLQKRLDETRACLADFEAGARRAFVRNAATRLFVQSNGTKNVSSWEQARVLWDAKPEDC